MIKPMADFTRRAVADVTSRRLCNGNGVVDADNEFWGDKPIELVTHSFYGDSADVTTQMMLFRTRHALKAYMFASPDSLSCDLCKILPI